MVAVTDALVEFNAVKEGILPVPLAARPIDGVLFVHVYAAAVPVKFTALVGELLHTTWLATGSTVGGTQGGGQLLSIVTVATDASSGQGDVPLLSTGRWR